MQGGVYHGSVGQGLTFNASRSVDAEGDIISYQWVFGDGTNGIGLSPVHAYSQPGIYSIRLTVTDCGNNAGTDTTSATID
jgi:PKD repeat protein